MEEELASRLSAVMDAVPVAEGVIYAKINGEVILGQTILEMNHKEIAKATQWNDNYKKAEERVIKTIMSEKRMK